MRIGCRIDMAETRAPKGRVLSGGFTVLELLCVVVIIIVLCLISFSAASRAKEQARSIRCRNQLRQIGVAMAVYLTESRRYPPLWDVNSSELWADKLFAPQRDAWTNVNWNCPTYTSKGGRLSFIDSDNISVSYSYNWRGTATGWSGRGKDPLPTPLGLGHLSKGEIMEPEVLAPVAMYVAADARGTMRGSELSGNPKMTLYRFAGSMEGSPLHGLDYNILFADGHIALIKRTDYLFPPRCAHSWNRDNLPHAETWAPSSEWAVVQ
jgi:prepilin-type processing-associated H-X9-DG protein